MLDQNTQSKILSIWNNYTKSNKVKFIQGNLVNDLDITRNKAIPHIQALITDFIDDKISIYEFKTSLDSYNKRNNLWGFPAIKGQMFFNQLTKSSEDNIARLVDLLKLVITEPKELNDALIKIEKLEKFTYNIFANSKDKRKAPNPRSIGYFLSYFWQIYNHNKWPILYTSLIETFKSLGIWNNYSTQNESYRYFFNLNEEIRIVVANNTRTDISNWDIEHAFGTYSNNTKTIAKEEEFKEITQETIIEDVSVKANFDIKDYLIPRVANLIELGKESSIHSSAKGYKYEKLVAEIFKQLDFEVEEYGQGTGRTPDAIAKYREENIAFIIDAKAYSNGYTLGTDDRAIREYVSHHIPKLQKEGYKKIGFIIVSNSFKSDFGNFINDITWNTDIKRFMLLTSEALLYVLAYKTKSRLSLASIIEVLATFSNVITATDIIANFDDI